MRIQPVQQNYLAKKNQVTSNYGNNLCSNSSNPVQNSSPSFEAGFRESMLRERSQDLKILKRTDAELKNLAEALHKSSDDTIKEIAEVYDESSLIGILFFGVDKQKSQIAYQKLSEAVKKVATMKNEFLSEINGGKSGQQRVDELKNEIRRLDEKAAKVGKNFFWYHEI